MNTHIYKYSAKAAFLSFLLLLSFSVFSEPRYELQPGDVLAVSVWKEEDLQQQLLVRPDGGISFPLAGDVQASGRTVSELSKELESRLSRFINDAQVTVSLLELNGNLIYVVGKVNRPGVYPFSQNIDVVQALSMAGGTTSFAALNEIKVLRRKNGKLESKIFRYSDIEKGRNLEQNFLLQSGDTVVVP